MIEFIKHVFSGQNQFASGGLLLMVIGAVGAYLRSIPQKLWYWIVGQTTMLITVNDDDGAFRLALVLVFRPAISGLVYALGKHKRTDNEAHGVVDLQDDRQKASVYPAVCR